MKRFKGIIAVLMMLILTTTYVFADNVQSLISTEVPQSSAPIKKALPVLAKADMAKALAIAEKYYNLGISKATAHEKNYIPLVIDWKPDFKGKNGNAAKAARYLNSSAYLTAYTDLKGIYLPLNAAVFTLDTGNATIAGNLASAIAAYTEDTDKKPLGLSIGGSKVSKAYADDAAAVYEYALALKLAKSRLDISAMPLLLNYGYISIDRGKLDSAKLMFETASKLLPGSLQAAEGMAAYWLAKGDKKKATDVLANANMTVVRKNVKKMQEESSEEKLPQVIVGESDGAAQNKLKQHKKVQTVLATDFYQHLDPSGAQMARHFVDNLQNSLHYTAPDFNYLSQYSTLKSFRSNGGWSALEAFEAELFKLEEELAKNDMSEAEADALGQELDRLTNDPNQDPEHIAEMLAQSSFTAKLSPELLVMSMKPGNYANPTDILTQQYNVAQLKRKKGSYEAYFATQMKEIMEVVLPAGEDLANKLEPLENAKMAQLEELGLEHSRSHKKSPCDPCILKTHEIHSRYDPEMNRMAEAAWMDVTNFVSARYTQRIKPNLEAMYTECTKNILLISDPGVRARTEENLKKEIEQFIYTTFAYVSQAYSLDIKGYPYECNCSEAELQAAAAREKAEQAKLEAERIPMQMKARQAFLSGEIPENSQLYQQLDKYTANFQLFFMKTKMHPLKTELSFDIKIPGMDTGITATMTDNHMRNTTTYGGGLNVGIGSKEIPGAPAKISGAVSIKGEMTVDGKGNVVTADIAAAAQGTITTDLFEASGTYEASVQRGCKLSAEVAEIYSNDVLGTPEELEPFMPEKPKKVLWQGEYQVTK